MNSFTVKLVTNSSFDCYPNNALNSFTIFSRWEVTVTELSYPSLYQNITEGKIFYLDETTPDTKPSDYYTLDPDIVNERNRKIQKREMYEKTSIKLHVNSVFLWVLKANFFESS